MASKINIIRGTDQDDNLTGTSETDGILAGNGDDTVVALGGDDIVQGGSGNDALYGGDGADYIYGGDGNDIVAGGPGADSLKGGLGFDIAVYDTLPTAPSREKGNAWLITIGGETDELKQFEQLRVDQDGSTYFFYLDGSNNPPLVFDDNAQTPEDTPLSIPAANLLANDYDFEGDPIAISSVGNALNGTVALDGDTITFTPASDYFGLASFEYTINGGLADGNVATVTVEITPVGLVGFARSVSGTATPLDVDGDYAYVGDVGGVLQVFDVSDSSNPLRLGTVSTGQEIGDLDVVGAYAYLGNDANGFCKYSVGDPDTLTFAGGRSDGAYAVGVDYDGGQYAYVGYGYTPGAELKVYDMTSFPSAPAASYDAAGDRHIYPLDVVGDRAYVMTANHGPYFEVIDVSAPLSPTYVSKIEITPSVYGHYMCHYEVVGDYAYVPTGSTGGFTGGLLVIDLSTETAPEVAAFFSIPDAGRADIAGPGIDVVGDRAYMASQSGLYIFDVSDPTDPNILVDPNTNADFAYPAEFLPSKGGWVEVQDNTAYVTSFRDYGQGGQVGGLAVFQLPENDEVSAGPVADDALLI
jgi:hypothetical protein